MSLLPSRRAWPGQATSTPANHFRQDINGLRALAVVAVILYHFDVGGLAGGFAGVDVFFVLSGYLMAGIIGTGLQHGDFSVLAFYWARARRILPALLVVCAVVLAIGWLLLAPNDYKTLGRHARQSLAFLSNHLYLKEAGYFDSASQAKWLLHTWSLSVEWQFYLALPLILALAWKLLPRRGTLVGVHLALFSCSLALCIALTASHPQKAFYLLPARAWEMLLGGLCFLLCSNLGLPATARRLLEAGGLALIGASVFLLDESAAWPGALALLPTLGTAMVLAARRETSPWCTHGAVQWLGTRSYSLYLWHWPLVAWLFHAGHRQTPLWIAAALLLTLILGELSYRLVEQPTRRWLGTGRRAFAVAGLAGLMILAGYLAQVVVRAKGFPQRMPADILAMREQALQGTPRNEECLSKGAGCVYGGPDIQAMLIGDSHAASVVTAAQLALPDAGQGIYLRAAPACLPVPGLHIREHPRDNPEDTCNRLRRQLPAELGDAPGRVPLIIVTRTSVYPLGYNGIDQNRKNRPQAYISSPVDEPSSEWLEAFARLYIDHACALARQRPVYLVRPIPEMRVDVPDVMSRKMLQGKAPQVTLSRADYEARNGFVWSVQDRAREACGVQILDPLPYLCDEEQCYGGREGQAYYADDNHLNAAGSRLLAPMFAEVFADLSTAQADPPR